MSMAQKIKEKGISLISFSSLTQNFHKEIFKQVLVPESLPVHVSNLCSEVSSAYLSDCLDWTIKIQIGFTDMRGWNFKWFVQYQAIPGNGYLRGLQR